ncbi:MAG TPA: IS1595 family transposase [Xanthobacteraceae bacterium]|nr:IS1595 family transposase [Xanthobacteraceae bacterium]
MSSVLNELYFHDEAAAFKALEAIVWPNGPTCPHCGAIDRIGRLEGVRSKPSKKHPQGIVRHRLWKCYHCKGQFTARKGTVFESSHLELRQWLQAAFLMCSSKKGVSSNQLARTLGITVKSAWFASHRLREAMRDGGLGPIGGEGKIVESDETFIGRKKGYPVRAGTAHKMVVHSLVERGGDVRSTVLDFVNRPDIERIVRDNVHRESRLMTDTAPYYRHRKFSSVADHEMVNHEQEEWTRGDVHTNTLEGFYSIFKRGMKGVYQHCSEKHLHRYIAEFDFRYNNRIARGVDDRGRTTKALRGVSGKRLTYRAAGN